MLTKRHLCTAASALLATGLACAQDDFSSIPFPEFDAFNLGYTLTESMKIKGAPADLTVSRLKASAFLAEPFQIAPDLTMIPMFSYSIHQLDFSGPYPIEDEDVHSAALSAIFVQDFSHTPWFAAVYARAELATDYQHIGTESFTFDLALGLGYKFSDTFIFGAGVVVTNLNGKDELFPGINFHWQPCEEFSAGLYGVDLLVKRKIRDNWNISLDGTIGGGHWNINAAGGQSRTVRLDSYWLSLNSNHQLTEKIWLSAGGGYTFDNQIEIGSNRRGGPSYTRKMRGGALATISLNIREW